MNIYMTREDVSVIHKYLDKDDVMLEWGSGGSTLYFSKYVNEYYSIEHDEKWYNKIKSQVEDNTHIYLCKPNHPRTVPAQRYQFEDYINYIEKIGVKFDKILIDDRARFFCTEKAVDYLKPNGVLFFHDWIREWYHSTLIYYELVEKTRPSTDNSGSLAVLKKRINKEATK